MVPLHVILSELRIELTWPSGWNVLSAFGTSKPSKTSTFLTCREAVSAFGSNFTLPTGMGALHITPLGLTPGSHEWFSVEPDGLRLSSHMNANAPLWTRPSVPTNFPAMNRMSVWNR